MSKTFKEFFITILIGFSLAIIFKFFIMDIVHVRGESMEPTIQNSDIMLLEKVSYYMKEPKIGDIVVVSFDKFEEKLIKRIVGVPGDVLEIKEGFLYRNGEKVEEHFIRSLMEQDMEEVEVPENHLFVMGDNRNHSTDSRELGVVPTKDVAGKVFIELKDDFFKLYK